MKKPNTIGKLTSLLNLEDVTEIRMSELVQLNSKRAEFVLNRIYNRKDYEIFENDTIFTINSDVLVTKEEISTIEKLSKKQYRQFSKLLDENGLWIEYCHE